MRIGLVGGSYRERSLPFDAQRTINLYPVLDEQGKQVSALYGTPGLKQFADLGAGPVRGAFAASNGRVFAVSENTLFEIYRDGTFDARGTLNSSSGNVSLDENGFQIGICDGREVYIFTFKDNDFSQPDDPPYVRAAYITFIDGYFFVIDYDTGKFFTSALYDGLSWDPLDFATAESSPDKLLCARNAVGQAWFFGEKTTEIWTNTGDSAFSFQRIAGAKMEVGILAPLSAVPLDNSIFWVGQDENGRGIVYRANGFSPQRISTSPIERIIQGALNPGSIYGYTYQQDGHVFYVLSGGSMKTTLVYDLTTGEWHERSHLNIYGKHEQHLSSCCVFTFGKTLVGDRKSGKIYEMSQDYYDDAGREILRERVYTHISDENKRLRMNRLEIDFETGVGLQHGVGENPMVEMSVSKDGARTWSNAYKTSIGRVGHYRQKVVFRRLGIAEQITFRIRFAHKVKCAIMGSYLS